MIPTFDIMRVNPVKAPKAADHDLVEQVKALHAKPLEKPDWYFDDMSADEIVFNAWLHDTPVNLVMNLLHTRGFMPSQIAILETWTHYDESHAYCMHREELRNGT